MKDESNSGQKQLPVRRHLGLQLLALLGQDGDWDRKASSKTRSFGCTVSESEVYPVCRKGSQKADTASKGWLCGQRADMGLYTVPGASTACTPHPAGVPT